MLGWQLMSIWLPLQDEDLLRASSATGLPWPALQESRGGADAPAPLEQQQAAGVIVVQCQDRAVRSSVDKAVSDGE